ncbi:MAG: DNA replication and repair protein RecF [Bacteroidetes bacterium]|nr:DNA replication and repair protein RecF [Bacteroidota bacterium]
MHLQRLQLFSFKNHTEAHFAFCSQLNCITGPNGSGKTNVLDAVYYLANAKSYFNPADSQIMQHGSSFFSVHGWFADGDKEDEILATFTDKGKKTLKKNDKTYNRLADHIGMIQTVFITPYDISLVLEGSEERRRFMDFTLCQTNREYLEVLSTYKRILEHRNSFLKKMEGRNPDPDIMDSYDSRLVPAANRIFGWRQDFISEFQPWFQEYYGWLCQTTETVALDYESELITEAYSDILRRNLDRDRVLQRTSSGIHKDDLVFSLQGQPLKKFGSQGQIKSFVIALKLAQYRYFLEKTGHKPILLLDDIFEKIDALRAGKLMELVARDFFGQIIITDTHAERVKNHLKSLDTEQVFFELGG